MGYLHLELNVFHIVYPVGEQNRRKIDVGEVTALERRESALCKTLDPFGTRPIVKFRISLVWRMLVTVMIAAHIVVVDNNGDDRQLVEVRGTSE